MLQDKWIEFAVELQSLAQAGLAYGKDVYDLERYTRIREIAAEMIACKSDIPLEKVKNLFCNETGYQTPKVDTRAAVFKEGKIHMIIWNSDGSQTENSGNGIRIFAKYLKEADYVQKKDITIYTDEKEIEIHYLNEEGTRLKASMGKASFWSDEVPVEGPRREIINETMVFGHIPYPVTCISVGNPHLVILMDEISKDLVCRIGKYSETAKQFPEKINTQIIKVLDRTHLQTEVYERGAGYTLASGSGCCAAAAAAYRLGLTDPKMIVQMPEGTMEVEIREDGEIFLTGDVGYVGSISLGSYFTEQLKLV